MKLDLLLLAVVLLHLVLCPYTKVEESFNMQALHDLMWHSNITNFDHFEFPGVVPRSFIGPAMVATITYPLQWLINTFVLPGDITLQRTISLYLVRFVIGLLCVIGHSLFKNEVNRKFGHNVARYFSLLSIAQFHLLFYMSRPLPNIFALFFVYIAFALWLRGRYALMFAILGFTATILRSELFVLIVPLAIQSLVYGKISLSRGLLAGLLSITVAIVYSMALDSYFWQRVIWPEGEVLYFNTLLNKSKDWGVSPFHWYFTSALPRSLLVALPLALLGVVIPSPVASGRALNTFEYLLPMIGFVLLYSNLPHKELRFIFYVLPIFNLCAAATLQKLNIYIGTRAPQLWKGIVWVVVFASTAGSLVFAAASFYNYHGADALNLLHSLESSSETVKYVHMDAHATMNGVSRFMELWPASKASQPLWRYSKNESLQWDEYKQFTHLITGTPDVHLNASFEVVATVEGFERIDYRTPALITTPKVYIMKNTNNQQQQQQPAAAAATTTVTATTHDNNSSNGSNEIEQVTERKLVARKDGNSPNFRWAQRKDKLYLTVDVDELTDDKTDITSTQFYLEGFGKRSQQIYTLLLELFADILPKVESYYVGKRWVKITLLKRTAAYWPRLLKQTRKHPNLRIDWDNWTDETDEEVDDLQVDEPSEAQAAAANVATGTAAATTTPLLPPLLKVLYENQHVQQVLQQAWAVVAIEAFLAVLRYMQEQLLPVITGFVGETPMKWAALFAGMIYGSLALIVLVALRQSTPLNKKTQ